MNLTILAASGKTGHELTRQALGRGHRVTAIARRPERINLPDCPNLRTVAGDVRDPRGIAAALDGSAIVLSGLGVTGGEKAGTLTAGAHAVVRAEAARIIWLGAYGSGASAQVAGPLTRTLLRMMGDRLTDKMTADSAVLAAGGTVFHAGPLTDHAVSPTRRTVGLDAVPRRLFPARVSRATVAAAMLDEAETPRFPGTTAVPLDR